MKKFLMILTLMLTLNTGAAMAAEYCKTPTVAHVKVNGLVCDFCARALEKVFSKQPEVKDIRVDLDKALVTVNFNKNKSLGDEALTKLITDAGYNVTGIHKMCE